MSVLDQIEARLPTMSAADRAIGAWILDHAEAMLRLSSSALAAETGRSQSTVVKFSQKLGFSSYQQLKLAVSEARAQRWQAPAAAIHGKIDKGDAPGAILQKLVASKIETMQRTASANSEVAFQAALEALDQAQRIHLAGVGASALVARDFAYKLLKLGRMAVYSDDSHVQLGNAAALRPGDLLVAFSQSGRSSATLVVAEQAKQRGAKILGVTGLAPNPLARMADLVLHAAADEERVRSSSILSRDAQLTLTDFLFLLLVQKQSDAAAHIHASESAVSVLKVQGR